MGKRSSQRKHAAMVDSDDDDSSASSSSTTRSDRMSVSGNEEVQLEKDSLLDHALDALYEKRGSTREKALSTIIEAFNSGLQHEFVEKKFATLLHHCIASIKKGSAKEVSLASHAVGLLALTVSCGNNAREILEETFPTLAQALKTGADSSKTSALLECLAIVTFVGGNDPAETERSMQIMWQLVHPKLGSNVAAVKPSPAIITAMVSAWAFLLTSIDGWSLDPKSWQESISYFSGLLDKDDRSVRIAAGEALAVIFDMGSLEKFCSQAKDASDGSTQDGKELAHVHGLRGKVLNQVRNLSVEAGGKGSAKKDLNSQRNLFKDILEFLEYGNSPEASIKIGGDVLQTSTWCKLIQLNFLKHFLGGGFVKHMQRLYKSPNSVINKARTQFLNKQRMLSEGRNVGRFAVGVADDEL
ncbi:uncharacterized protein LOC115739590 isoform X4 [Rhodamnia argentea]|uniref:Uncharacterized protein LOC115739590 isoform X4 n=1 Tax=Rhodamnia argentea TaxID=178133 RepID=A0ABM3H268_9MYRT|nr:uncharacterized protein LOC115739590 isoform X4 [Rhodamnia argentea]